MHRLPRPFLYLLLLTSLLFTLAGVAMVASGAGKGWLVLIFFGVCAAVAVMELWPGLLLDRRLDPEGLLSRFPEPVVLHASPKRSLFLMLTGAGFAGACGWLLFTTESSLTMAIALWPAVILLGLAIPLFVAMLVWRPLLRLSTEGLFFSHLWRRGFMRWSEVGDFSVAALPPAGMRLVVFDHRPGGVPAGGGFGRAITGRNASLPDSYGLSPEDLARLLGRWRERALAAGPAGQGS